jgi:hypothetical protein
MLVLFTLYLSYYPVRRRFLAPYFAISSRRIEVLFNNDAVCATVLFPSLMHDCIHSLHWFATVYAWHFDGFILHFHGRFTYLHITFLCEVPQAVKKHLSVPFRNAIFRGIIATERCCFAQLLKVVHSCICNMFSYCDNRSHHMRSNGRKLTLDKPNRSFMKSHFHIEELPPGTHYLMKS